MITLFNAIHYIKQSFLEAIVKLILSVKYLNLNFTKLL